LKVQKVPLDYPNAWSINNVSEEAVVVVKRKSQLAAVGGDEG
jgi:hypothetical protein